MASWPSSADWDRDALALEFKELLELEVDLDLTITGFETAEIDLVLDGDRNGGPDPADAEVEVTGPAVSRTGDLWLLDLHRLFCGDALASTSYPHVLGGERADFLILGPTLQRAGQRPRQRAREDAASGVPPGQRRAQRGRVHRIPRDLS